MVSFGTSYNDNRDLSIGSIENALRLAYPDYEVRRAFTSQIIIDKLKEL
ncbi:MAG: sirohydrochlorin cobaltochelatase [Evtepia gabavorous]